MLRTIAALALAAIAPVAAADYFKFDIQVSTNNGATWGKTASVPTSGGAVKVRFMLSAERAAGFVSIGGCQTNALNLTSVRPGDSLSDLVQPPGAIDGQGNIANFVLSGNAIVRAGGGAMFFGQFPLLALNQPSGAVADNPLFAGSLVYNVAPTDVRSIDISTSIGGPTGLRSCTVYTNATGANAQFPISQVIFDGATINVIPAPATGAMLGLVGLTAARRRR